eukprot:TRINITY_DN5106_c0_g1_i1.p1 TRINITY_DN5106_c0_g1~~TRINITY_DN5106_c0_g1_i1.p1  ORF type:complete len:236 (-),score=13.15 TRINITY_DN5106_c0_g1_i1:282-989(-)
MASLLISSHVASVPPLRPRTCLTAGALLGSGCQRASVSLPRAGATSTILSFTSSSIVGNPLRGVHIVKSGGSAGGAAGTVCSVVISTETLRWVATAASVALLLAKNTGAQKPLVVPLLALTVPQEVITWIRGEYGLWVAFLGLVVRLFFSIPGELELPLAFLMFVITAPLQLLSYRGQPAAAVVSLVIASILAYQHFSRSGGGVSGAFQKTTVLPSLAVIFVLLVPIIFFLQGVY